ncbi:hypothetical protein KM043_008281 [Ampulex compressa]|nr:hypothetical protein KM043_008281 [Ampulex compressa]
MPEQRDSVSVKKQEETWRYRVDDLSDEADYRFWNVSSGEGEVEKNGRGCQAWRQGKSAKINERTSARKSSAPPWITHFSLLLLLSSDEKLRAKLQARISKPRCLCVSPSNFDGGREMFSARKGISILTYRCERYFIVPLIRYSRC